MLLEKQDGFLACNKCKVPIVDVKDIDGCNTNGLIIIDKDEFNALRCPSCNASFQGEEDNEFVYVEPTCFIVIVPDV